MAEAASYRPNPLRQAVKRLLLRTVPRSKLVSTLPAGAGGIALTFDDGPHAEWTPRILDALAERNARATFFVIGERAAALPDLVRRLQREGHALGHHSWTHSEPATTSAAQLLAETARTRDCLEQLTGTRVPLFRPPHGKLTAAKLLGVWRKGNAVVLWNQDPKDYQMQDASELLTWVGRHPLSSGDIVLLHDVHRQTAEAMPRLLATSDLPFVALQ